MLPNALMLLPRRLLRSRDGSVMLETALTITILLVLMLGIIDLGRLLYTENNLVSAAREGARAAAVDPSSGSTLISNTRTVVQNHFSPFGGSALTATDPPIHVECTPTANCSTPISSVKVRITYTFTWLTPLWRLLAGASSNGSRSLNAQAEYKYEQ